MINKEFFQNGAYKKLGKEVVDVADSEAFEPYEITIRFNSKPSDVAVAALVESIVTIKSKHKLDFDFVQHKAFFV
jgi:hypothetical protein